MTPIEFAKDLILDYDMQNLSFSGKERLINEITEYTAAIRQAALEEAASVKLKFPEWIRDAATCEIYSIAVQNHVSAIRNLKSQPSSETGGN